MKRFIILLIVSSLLACKNHAEISGQVEKKQIHLSTEVSTKGSLVTTASIKQFVVFGFYTDKKTWDAAVNDNTAIPDLMNDVNVVKSKSGEWEYDPVVYWDDRELNTNYSFFGYSPRASADNGISLLTDKNTVGYQRLRYQTLPDVEKQIDLVISSRINYASTGDVNMNFKHALSRVGLRAFTNIPGTRVKSFKISGVAYKGEVNVSTPVLWSVDNSSTLDLAVTFRPEVSVSFDKNNPTDLTLGGKLACVLLPQNLAQNGGAKLEVTYVQNGKEISKSYTIQENYQAGQGIIYELNLSGVATDDLLVSVELTDWTFGGKWDINSNDGVQPYFSLSNAAQAGIPSIGGSYTVTVDSEDPWNATCGVGGVTITPATGGAGSTSVVITVPANLTINSRDIPVVFTIEGVTLNATWTGSQLALPQYPIGSYITTDILKAAGWPADRLPATGLQVATRGNYRPNIAPAGNDIKIKWLAAENIYDEFVPNDVKLGTGKSNYATLNKQDSITYPIGHICSQLGDEWYVPSRDELKLISNNRMLLTGAYEFVSGESDFTWTSSQSPSAPREKAEIVHVVNDGYESLSVSKKQERFVRCVREF